jgi:hypothetical protein
MRNLNSHKPEVMAIAVTTVSFGAVLWFSAVALLLALPWIAATAWLVKRHGLGVLLAGETKAIPAQAAQLRAFSGAVPR